MELTTALRVAGTLLAASISVFGLWWVSRAREASEDYEVALSVLAYSLLLSALVVGLVELWRQ